MADNTIKAFIAKRGPNFQAKFDYYGTYYIYSIETLRARKEK